MTDSIIGLWNAVLELIFQISFSVRFFWNWLLWRLDALCDCLE